MVFQEIHFFFNNLISSILKFILAEKQFVIEKALANNHQG